MPDRPATYAIVCWLLLLAMSIALSALAAAHDTLPGDAELASWIQGLALPGDTLADALRSITFTQFVVAAGVALAALLWLRGYRREAAAFAASLIILLLLQAGIKEIVDRPRPGPEELEIRGSFSSPSFPSGHVMSGTFLYGFLAYAAFLFPLPAAARVSLAVASCAVIAASGPANVWLGVHWPSDVAGGYAWGALVLLAAVFACERWRQR